MQTLYVLETGSYLRKEGETLVICKGKQRVETIPAAGLKQLTLAGRASISGAVLDFLINHGIDTVFMTMDGRFRARLLLDDSSHTALRQRQYVRLNDPAYKQGLAAVIVREKLENQSRLLLRRASQYDRPELRTVGAQIKALRRKSTAAADLETLRGIEGYGSRLYFSVFGLLLRNEAFYFHGRNRRPPRDPVNALLSFVYTLFTNEVLNGVKSAGLDPYCGALHEIAAGRPSLACDLVEEWRPFAERLVLGLVNRKAIRPEDFVFRNEQERTEGQLPVSMKPNAARALIAAYQRQLEERLLYPPTGQKTAVRWIMHSQCRHFAESLKTGAMYSPFQVPR
ncbi:CRISPR-associated endonuclease Cas1 [Desulfobulbus elongatus]|uniref:CRISPR-associated endonuclease Cas1 n=1 Tax=Desulfobulbus elongatus TaxID=53332 RepID=UPI000483B49D|nr:CRISPR-associated endonuclease Cas1 [Desulfobulbus elongatus]